MTQTEFPPRPKWRPQSFEGPEGEEASDEHSDEFEEDEEEPGAAGEEEEDEDEEEEEDPETSASRHQRRRTQPHVGHGGWSKSPTPRIERLCARLPARPPTSLSLPLPLPCLPSRPCLP